MLTPPKVEVDTKTWREVELLLKDAIVSISSILGTHGTPQDVTEYHRGRLSMAQDVLRLAQPDFNPYLSANVAEKQD